MATLSYSDIALLRSIQAPRAIKDPQQMDALRRLAKIGLVSFGSTLEESDAAPHFWPTAKLTPNAYKILDSAILELGVTERLKLIGIRWKSYLSYLVSHLQRKSRPCTDS